MLVLLYNRCMSNRNLSDHLDEIAISFWETWKTWRTGLGWRLGPDNPVALLSPHLLPKWGGVSDEGQQWFRQHAALVVHAISLLDAPKAEVAPPPPPPKPPVIPSFTPPAVPTLVERLQTVLNEAGFAAHIEMPAEVPADLKQTPAEVEAAVADAADTAIDAARDFRTKLKGAEAALTRGDNSGGVKKLKAAMGMCGPESGAVKDLLKKAMDTAKLSTSDALPYLLKARSLSRKLAKKEAPEPQAEPEAPKLVPPPAVQSLVKTVAPPSLRKAGAQRPGTARRR